MLRPVVSLVAARTRRRGATTALSIAAIGMATALVAIVAGTGLVAADATLARALATTGADRPVVRASAFSSSGRNADIVDSAATTAMSGLAPSLEPTVRGVLLHQLLDLETPVVDLIAAIDGPQPWVQVLEGRLPAPCIDGLTCEAMLLSETPLDPAFDVAVPAEGARFTIVGRGQVDAAVPFGVIDQRGPVGDEPGGGQYQTERASPAVILVDGVAAIANSPAFDTTGRTYLWTAPLDLEAIHPWTADAFQSATQATATQLAESGNGFTLTSPASLVRTELTRAEGASGRLLLIGSLGVAILLAFAVFLALVVRDDVKGELERLAAVGARRRDRVAFLVLEAAIPAAVGGLIGWVVGGVVVGALAAWSGVDALAVIAGTLLAPGAVIVMLFVLAAAVAAIVLASAPGLRFTGATTVAAAIGGTAIVILGWQLAAGGSIGADGLARSLVSPIVVLLPPVCAFVLALAFVAVLPPLLRALARRTRRAPLPVRLSLLSVSREPARPAATLTLLAFSLGAIVFAAGWSASLRQGIEDSAAYRSGLDLRVSELGTGLSIGGSVVPLDRYAALGGDVSLVPVYRDAAPNQEGGRVDVLALPPDALPTLPGWRSDFSTTPIAELAERLTMAPPAGGWTLAGHRLDPSAADLELDFRYTGRPLRLDAIVVTDEGDTAIVRMGDVDESMTTISAPLPGLARGGLLTALVFRNPGLVAGSGHQDELRRATVSFLGLDGLVDDGPRELEIFTTSAEIIQAPQVTDGVRLPVIVSPDLAAEAAADGALDLEVANERTIPLQVVGVADRMPTVVEPKPRFLVAPLDPFLVAMAGTVPGAGRPTEMWIGVSDAARLADVRTALAREPFRFAEVTARADLVAERAGDPLSQAIVWTLIVSALSGLVLSVGGLILGTVTDLRDERGELADLEAQGVTPSTLRWHALARTTWLAVGGSLAGLAVGLVLTALVTVALSVTAEGTTPIPPLAIVIPVVPIVVIVLAVLAVVLGTAAWLARRAYGRATLGERRAAHRPGDGDRTWAPAAADRADG
ncbi:MAG TPA: FtsX-like permease family protein [Candidatus Saccharimonadales bacterium]|nr:FtsX-like permease family protein [Candidatus Saccharimonadales bacterium]